MITRTCRMILRPSAVAISRSSTSIARSISVEDLTAAVAQSLYSRRASVSPIGRPGQSQKGVDVHIDQGGFHTGIQCKRRSELDANGDLVPGGRITSGFLRKAAEESDHFSPNLNQFILATTASRDATIQTTARELSEERRAVGKSPVKIWAWDDYVTFLNQFDDLERMYYNNILRVRSAADHDRRIIDVITRAFNRPAFEDPLGNEHGDSFDTALADTVHALNDGILIERRSRREFEVAHGGRSELTNPIWRSELDALYMDVATIRSAFATAKKLRQISIQNSYVVVNDQAVADFIDRKRLECLQICQKLRAAAGFPPY